MKVLFVIPPIKSMLNGIKVITPHPHMGIAYLVSVLKKNKIPVRVFDFGVEKNDRELDKIINNFKPEIIGITGFSYSLDLLRETIVKVKQLTNSPIIVGGPHVSATKDEILKETGVNFSLKGEGEISFLLFLKQLEKKKSDFSKVPGLIYKIGEEIFYGPSPVFIKNIDEIPFPDYEEFNLKKYPCYIEKMLPIMTSRGCPYQCTYCSAKLSAGSIFRPRSPKNVLKEITYWYKKGFTSFDFNDDCFSFDLNRAKEICDLIIKHKLKIKFQLYNGIRVDRVDLNLLKAMKKVGCTFINFGCESGNETILISIKKGITLEQVKQAVAWANEAGIKNTVSFIIGHPRETYKQALETIAFAKSLPASYINFNNLVPYPGTEAYEWVLKNGHFLVSLKDYLNKVSYKDLDPIFETKAFTAEQRISVLKTASYDYERKVFELRFGKLLGKMIFRLSRFNIVTNLFQRIVSNNLFLIKIYYKIIRKT